MRNRRFKGMVEIKLFTDSVLGELDAEDVVAFFGVEAILDEIGIIEIKEYLEEKEGEEE